MTKAIKAREWLVKAEQDLKYARLVLPNHSDLFEVALYHCQQCAEKSLKGYLVFNDIRFEKTHNLETLIYQCETKDKAFSDLLSVAQSLTPFATDYRYPSGVDSLQLPSITLEEFEEAVKNAETIYHFVLSRLPEEVHP